jgi:hypothetical protein
VTRKPIRADAHDLHERLLIVRFATNDELQPDEAARARALMAGCAACAALSLDVQTISRATAVSLTAARARDFRLTPEQAAAARGSRIRRWLARLSTPGMGTLRPLAGAAVALGMLLVVVGGGLSGFGTGSITQTNGTAGMAIEGSQEATPADGPLATAAEGAPVAAPAAPSAARAAPSAGPAASAAAADNGITFPPSRGAAQGTAIPTVTTQAAGPGPTSRPSTSVKQTAPEPEPSREGADLPQTPAPSEPPAIGFAGAASSRPTGGSVAVPVPAPTGSQPQGGSPLVPLGILLGIVGLAVLGLSWLAVRVTKDRLLR